VIENGLDQRGKVHSAGQHTAVIQADDAAVEDDDLQGIVGSQIEQLSFPDSTIHGVHDFLTATLGHSAVRTWMMRQWFHAKPRTARCPRQVDFEAIAATLFSFDRDRLWSSQKTSFPSRVNKPGGKLDADGDGDN